MTPPIGTSILYCLAPADIAPGLRMRQTEFAAIVTAVHAEGLVDLTYFPPPGIGLDTVAQAALVPHRTKAAAGRSFWTTPMVAA